VDMGEMDTESLLKLLSETDPVKVGDFLKEIEKYEALIDKVSGLLMRLNRIGILPAFTRIAGVKMGIKEDINAPLSNPLMITAATPQHYTVFDKLNEVTPQQLEAIFIGNQPKEKKKSKAKK